MVAVVWRSKVDFLEVEEQTVMECRRCRRLWLGEEGGFGVVVDDGVVELVDVVVLFCTMLCKQARNSSHSSNPKLL